MIFFSFDQKKLSTANWKVQINWKRKVDDANAWIFCLEIVTDYTIPILLVYIEYYLYSNMCFPQIAHKHSTPNTPWILQHRILQHRIRRHKFTWKRKENFNKKKRNKKWKKKYPKIINNSKRKPQKKKKKLWPS